MFILKGTTTAALVFGASTLTDTKTTFSSSLVGKYVVVDHIYYPIASLTSTVLTITGTWPVGRPIGWDYKIADTVELSDVELSGSPMFTQVMGLTAPMAPDPTDPTLYSRCNVAQNGRPKRWVGITASAANPASPHYVCFNQAGKSPVTITAALTQSILDLSASYPGDPSNVRNVYIQAGVNATFTIIAHY